MTSHIIYVVFSVALLIASLLPLSSNQHWFFRVWEFGRIQLLVIELTLIFLGFLFYPNQLISTAMIQLLLAASAIQHMLVLRPYFPVKSASVIAPPKNCSVAISVISANVFQPNISYQKLVDLIKDKQPDIFLTIESNSAWGEALSEFDELYPYHQKIPLENTYGMHFYSKLETAEVKVNYLVAEDLPSIEAVISTPEGYTFRLFGVHPPPPSPTEEPNSKERDGELIAIGKIAKKSREPVVVIGDFNNVAWSKSTVLFRKVSGLIDSRRGRGMLATYHAKYWFLRFPIDLFFHSNQIHVSEINVLQSIDSDHFPLHSVFHILPDERAPKAESENLSQEEKKTAEEFIQEGVSEQSEER